MANPDARPMTPAAALARHLEWLEYALTAAREEEDRRRGRLDRATPKNRDKRAVRLAEVRAEVDELSALVQGIKDLQAAAAPAPKVASEARAEARIEGPGPATRHERRLRRRPPPTPPFLDASTSTRRRATSAAGPPGRARRDEARCRRRHTAATNGTGSLDPAEAACLVRCEARRPPRGSPRPIEAAHRSPRRTEGAGDAPSVDVSGTGTSS